MIRTCVIFQFHDKRGWPPTRQMEVDMELASIRLLDDVPAGCATTARPGYYKTRYGTEDHVLSSFQEVEFKTMRAARQWVIENKLDILKEERYDDHLVLVCEYVLPFGDA